MSRRTYTLKQARGSTGMTQKEAAKMLGVHWTTLSNWERGRTVPRIDDIMKISEVYGIKQEDIFLPCYSNKSRIDGEEAED